jgi:hypothetical protein
MRDTHKTFLQRMALLVGAVFLLIGVLGFVPGVTTTDEEGMKLLLGLFMVGTVHNVIHLASGVLALLGSGSPSGARSYFLGFGAVYALVTLIGFIQGDTVLGIIHVNLADNLLHLALAVLLLGLGLMPQRDTTRPTTGRGAAIAG